MNIIKPGKLIRTNKDLVFWTIWSSWLVSNIITMKVFGDVTITNLFFILVFTILILVQSYNKKIANWLKKYRNEN